MVPVLWNRTGLSAERLKRAVREARSFPREVLSAELEALFAHAAAASTARELLAADDWKGLHAHLSGLPDEFARDLDEIKMAWQEYLTYELGEVTKAKDQVGWRSLAPSRAHT